jgi:cell division transport system permease protein
MLTAGTMGMSLFVFGAFMILQENLQHFLTGLGDQIQINAYLQKGLDASETHRLLSRIRTFPEVERARHVSQEQAWRDFSAALGAQSNLLDGLPPDILPPSFEILIKPAYRDGPLIEDLANRLKKEPRVTTVEYPQQWVDRLSLVVLAVQWTKWLLGGVLFMAAFFIVGSTVKLAILARKDEIEIMQLVGASEELIQAPFVLEGMIQGVAAGALSVACLWFLFRFLDRQVTASAGLFGLPAQLQFLGLESIALLVAVGWALGAAGSLFALRRFVRTWKS